MVCSCYYSFYFNALKRYPIPTPRMGLHNTPPIILVIIGDIPPGGYFWEKILSLTSTHYCVKALSTFPQSFPHNMLHVRRSIWITQQPYIYCIYPSYTVNTTMQPLPVPQLHLLPNQSNLSPLYNLLYLPILSIKLLSFFILYHIYYYIISLTILSLSILHHSISFYLIHHITSILY